jgi:PEP-CTERM motif
MNTKWFVAFLLGIALVLAVPARADRIRTASSYGQIINSQPSAIGTQSLVPLTPISLQDGDLLLQISPTSPDLGKPLQVTITLSGTEFIAGTGTFGVVDCPGSNLGTVCTPSTNPTCDLSAVLYSGGMLTLPGTCDVANETFYFDEPMAPNMFTGTFAQVTAVTSSSMPEPSAFALLGLGLLSVMAFLKRRVQA